MRPLQDHIHTHDSRHAEILPELQDQVSHVLASSFEAARLPVRPASPESPDSNGLTVTFFSVNNCHISLDRNRLFSENVIFKWTSDRME